ncbi:hypothetical protein Tco_1440465 [Tanacetum coccineum]
MFKEFESGGASGSDGCGDDEESGDDEDDDDERQMLELKTVMVPTSSLDYRWDLSLTSISPSEPLSSQRHVAGETFPQRHVAGENPEMSLGKTPIVVVGEIVFNCPG